MDKSKIEGGLRSSYILLRDGDQNAFEQIYLHYMPSVRDYLVMFTRSKEAGREIAQDVFVKLWENRERIDHEKAISGYLFTIARNYALKYLATLNKYSTEDISTREVVAEESASADTLYLTREVELIVEIAVSRMPPQRRKIYELSRNDKLSNAEIAELMKISKNTVENHITSALREIRKAWASYACLLGLMI
jgi:RNA polymerase sigma-70 factor (ECF subfamily)